MTTLPAGTRPGAVHLRVRDLDRVRDFWVERLDLTATVVDGGATTLAAEPDGPVLLALHPDPQASPPRRDATGLFHLALLVPDRASLGRVLVRLLRDEVPLQGASDHLVSEALYLSDPEGNGIEIYADRPREDWSGSDGVIRMATLPLDLQSLIAEAGGEPQGIPAGTRMGHVHLRVGDLEASERFYGPDGIGLDVTTRDYPGARFLSAAGYHHHLGMNVWGVGSGPAPGSAGLLAWTLVIPDSGAAAAAAARVGAREVAEGRWEATDPDGILLWIGTDATNAGRGAVVRPGCGPRPARQNRIRGIPSWPTRVRGRYPSRKIQRSSMPLMTDRPASTPVPSVTIRE